MDSSMNRYEEVLTWTSVVTLIFLQFDFVHNNLMIRNLIGLVVCGTCIGNIIVSAIMIKKIKKENGPMKTIYGRYFIIVFMSIMLGILLYAGLSSSL